MFGVISCGQIKDLAPRQTNIIELEPAELEPFTYQLLDEDCSTGRHEFHTLREICEALRDDELNQSCAAEERENLFVTAECSGDFE